MHIFFLHTRTDGGEAPTVSLALTDSMIGEGPCRFSALCPAGKTHVCVRVCVCVYVCVHACGGAGDGRQAGYPVKEQLGWDPPRPEGSPGWGWSCGKGVNSGTSSRKGCFRGRGVYEVRGNTQ